MSDSVSNPGTGSGVVSVDQYDEHSINSDNCCSGVTSSDVSDPDHLASHLSGSDPSHSHYSEDNDSAIENGASFHSTQRAQSENSYSDDLDYDNDETDNETDSQVSQTGRSPTVVGISYVPGRKTPSLDAFNLNDIKFSNQRLEAQDNDGNLLSIGYVRFNSVTLRNAWTEMDAIKSCTLEFRLAGLDFLPSDGQPNPVNDLAALYNDVVRTIKKAMKEMKSAGKYAHLTETELIRSASVLLELDTIAYFNRNNPWNKDGDPWSGYLPEPYEILAMRFLDPKGSIPGEIAGMVSSLGRGNLFTSPGAGVNQARQSGHHDSSGSDELESLKSCIMDLQQRVKNLEEIKIDSLVKLEQRLRKVEDAVWSKDGPVKRPNQASNAPQPATKKPKRSYGAYAYKIRDISLP